MNYFHICHTELWYFAHNVHMEQNSELVALGRLAHEEHYERDTSKERFMLEGIRIDRITPNGYIHEIKKSNRAENAHIWQIKYYLYVLKNNGFGELKGKLEFPKQRKTIAIENTSDDEKIIQEKLAEIRNIIAQPEPLKAKKIGFCRKCSYRELCWA